MSMAVVVVMRKQLLPESSRVILMSPSTVVISTIMYMVAVLSVRLVRSSYPELKLKTVENRRETSLQAFLTGLWAKMVQPAPTQLVPPHRSLQTRVLQRLLSKAVLSVSADVTMVSSSVLHVVISQYQQVHHCWINMTAWHG